MAKFIVEKRVYFLIVFALLSVISLFLMQRVVVNYNLTEYLPQDMPTSKSISLMEEEFGIHGLAQVMAKDVDIPEALRLKEEIRRIPGVENVLWLDDFADITLPLSISNPDVVNEYFVDGDALFQVHFSEGDYSLKTGEAIEQLEMLNDATLSLRGPALDAFRTRQTATSEILAITLFVAPIFFLILLFSMSSWIEPLIFVITIGISILINMGTNMFLGQISYITQASSSLLQFAVTMDYSIFLLHRFGEERAKGIETKQAMINAIKHSFSAISASSMTTVAGFTALMFMRYGIGFDLGAVLAKGVVLSFIAVMTLLPALIILFEKTIERTHHRAFMPDLSKAATGIMKRKFIMPLVLILLPIAFLAQSANQFIYSDGAVSEKSAINEVFGAYNPLILLVPNGDIQREERLSVALKGVEGVDHFKSLFTFAHSSIPREMLPTRLLDNFQSENFTRMILNIASVAESPQAFETLENIREIANRYYPGQHFMIGQTSAISDIREVVEQDFTTTSMIAILAVGLIILLTFRSLALPVILVLVIQAAIWINMAIPYFTGSPLIFIGYMIVSAVQLGATIDYAILLTGRYMEHRKTAGCKEAAIDAIVDSGNSIMTSAAIMSAAGFTLGYISGIPGIAALGMLLGRGALLSCILALTLLPQLLVTGDKLIRYTTLKHRFLG